MLLRCQTWYVAHGGRHRQLDVADKMTILIVACSRRHGLLYVAAVMACLIVTCGGRVSSMTNDFAIANLRVGQSFHYEMTGDGWELLEKG